MQILEESVAAKRVQMFEPPARSRPAPGCVTATEQSPPVGLPCGRTGTSQLPSICPWRPAALHPAVAAFWMEGMHRQLVEQVVEHATCLPPNPSPSHTRAALPPQVATVAPLYETLLLVLERLAQQ